MSAISFKNSFCSLDVPFVFATNDVLQIGNQHVRGSLPGHLTTNAPLRQSRKSVGQHAKFVFSHVNLMNPKHPDRSIAIECSSEGRWFAEWPHADKHR